MTKFKSQALHIIRIEYWKASGSGNPPSLIPTLRKIAISGLKTKFYLLFCTRLHVVKVSKFRNKFSCSHHSMARANLNKSKKVLTSTTTASKYIPKRPRICINWNPPFQTQIYLRPPHVLWQVSFGFWVTWSISSWQKY